jgi:hypothetical protein
MDVALLSETHVKSHERFFLPNCHFYQTDRFPGRKGGTAIAVRKGIPHNNVDVVPLVSVEATGVCIFTGNSECYLQQSVSNQTMPGMMQTLLNF